MKPWARYEVGFINHDKFRAITPNAIGLWLEGKNYADDKLTDGRLPDYEVKHWRFHSKKSVALLTASCGLKPGTATPYAPLWEVVPAFGFQMHDYLQHNECREKALIRIANAEDEKAKEKQRKAIWRANKAALSGACPAHVPPSVPPENRDIDDLSGSIQRSEDRDQKTERTHTAREPDLVLAHYRELWHQTYGHECSLILSPLEQMKLEQQVAKLPILQMQQALAAYFVTTDDYVRRAKHPLALFLRDPMRHVATTTEPAKLSREDEAAAVLAMLKRREAGDWSL